MSRYFIEISYNGGSYSGWQIQPNAMTVQQVIEDSLSVIRQKETSIVGAGRTDAGVHARCMVAHLDMDENDETVSAMVRKLDRFLPKDISVYSVRKVKDDAHARFDAISRTYKYYVSLKKDPFNIGTVLEMYKPLDFDAMNIASKYLLGRKDFTSFSKLHTDVKTNICDVKEAYWSRNEDDDMWVFTITADRFLRNMVRAIVGTLFLVGWGKISCSDFNDIIESKDRSKAGSSADAHALFLEKVLYPY